MARSVRGLACAVFSAVALCATGAGAEPGGKAHLEYVRDEGADSCPDELALRNAVAARLGSDPFWPVAPLRISVVMDASGGELRARVALREGESGKRLGVRNLRASGADCAELFAAMVLAVCIAIDPESATRDAPSEIAAPAAGDPPPSQDRSPHPQVASVAPRDTAVTTERPTPRSGQRLAWEATLGGTVDVGTSPSPSFGVAIGGGVRYGTLRLSVEARGALQPVAASVDGGNSVRATPMPLIGLVPCLDVVDRMAVCAVGYGGALRGETTTDRETLVTPLALLGGRLAVDVPVGDAFFLRAHGEVLGNLTPTSLRADGEEIWSTPPLGAAMALGAGRRF